MSKDQENYCYPMLAGKLKKGSHLVINDRPCKVIDTTISKTGKHGGAKIHISASDIFNQNKCVGLFSTAENIMVPYVDKYDYQLVDITNDSFYNLMDDKGVVREDIKCIVDIINNEIRAKFEDGDNLDLVLLCSMGIEQVIDYKISK
jgi:translation initiation factor 5A